MSPSNRPIIDRDALHERLRTASYKGRSATPQLIIGVFIMIAGVLLMADRLDLFDFTGALRYWPVPIVGIGVFMLTQRSDPHGRFWGTIWLVLGLWLLLNSLGVLRVGFGEVFWPFVLIFIGVKLVTHAMRHEAKSEGGSGASLFAVMGESKRITNESPFRGAQMTAFMGGCQMDLRQAVIPAGGEATIDVFSIMGGLEVWVPTQWDVVSQIVPVMGSVDDKRLPSATQQPTTETTPRLLLRGQIIMSGLTIKN